MNYRQSVVSVLPKTKLTSGQKKKLEAAASDYQRFPRLWKSAENMSVHRYEQDTGKKFDGDFGAASWLDWLVKNLPSIIKILLAIFSLFGV